MERAPFSPDVAGVRNADNARTARPASVTIYKSPATSLAAKGGATIDTNHRSVAVLLIVCALAAGCSGKSSPVTPSIGSLTGLVETTGGAGISGATVTILDGVNSGMTATTTSDGGYAFPLLTPGQANVSADACGYQEERRSVNIDGTDTLGFALGSAALWSVSGTGDADLQIPASVTEVKVALAYSDSSAEVQVTGALWVDVLMGTDWQTTTYSEIDATTGGPATITGATGVSWTFSQVCP